MSETGLMIALFTVLFTLFVVLTERKVLAYAMRRMGPSLMGRNGAFQMALDLFKLLTKDIFMMPRPTTALVPVFLTLFYACQLLFSQNFVWGPSMYLFENVDSMMLYHLILMLLGNIFFVIVGLLSQSRYTMMATVSSLVHVISLDMFITIMYSLLVFTSQSANFSDFVITQNMTWFIFLYAPAAAAFLVVFLLESKRTPFDHAETESEVVAGYATEYSGPMLLVCFLGEYLHLVIASINTVLFFLGGWHALDFLWFLPTSFLTAHDMHYYLELFFNYFGIKYF